MADNKKNLPLWFQVFIQLVGVVSKHGGWVFFIVVLLIAKNHISQFLDTAAIVSENIGGKDTNVAIGADTNINLDFQNSDKTESDMGLNSEPDSASNISAINKIYTTPIYYHIVLLFAVILGLGGIIYGIYQRKLLKSQVARMSERIQTLEQREDPDRSSCGLTREGDTHLKDR